MGRAACGRRDFAINCAGHHNHVGRAQSDRQGETVSEFFVNPKSCHDISAETEPTGCRMLLQLAVDSKQPLYGAGLKPALGKISEERAGLKPAPITASCYDFGR